MRLKKEYFILAGVMIALILYLVLHHSNRTHYKLPDITAVSGKQISKLEIDKAGKTVVLNKKDNTWYIGLKAYTADSTKVKNMLNMIEKLTLTALVSESKNYVRYDLANDKKITVKAWDGKTLSREFGIGKAATTHQHTFVRLAADPQKDIREITLTHDKKTMTLSQKQVSEQGSKKKDKQGKTSKEPETKMVWQDAEGNKVDETKVSRLLSFFNRLECEKYINDAKKADFINPILAVTLKGEKGYSLSVFAKKEKDGKNNPAISSENDYPFLLSDSQVNSIKTKIDDIMGVKKKT
ncbi:MAG: DUF4340 domain-containing protein [Deltaproteobacteria bacterium]|nr:DUF4340 domain-containing protein [Deltaproteobacteria bacterium]